MQKTKKKYENQIWAVPSKRAKKYALERKVKVHTNGPKEGKELTDYEAGMRSGYLQCQSDHAGMYKFKKALAEGRSKEDAKIISQNKIISKPVKSKFTADLVSNLNSKLSTLTFDDI